MEAITTVSWSWSYPRLQRFLFFFSSEAENLHGSDLEAEKERRVENKKGCRRHRKKTRTRQHPDADRNQYCILYTIYGKSRSNNLLIGDAFLLPFVWFRYVDDTILVMQNWSQGEQFVSKPQSVLTIQLNPTYKLIKTHIFPRKPRNWCFLGK